MEGKDRCVPGEECVAQGGATGARRRALNREAGKLTTLNPRHCHAVSA